MQTITLSENAVAVLCLRMKGLRMPATDNRLEAYRELIEAGIMESAEDGFLLPRSAGHTGKNCSASQKTESSANGSSHPTQANCRNAPGDCCGG